MRSLAPFSFWWWRRICRRWQRLSWGGWREHWPWSCKQRHYQWEEEEIYCVSERRAALLWKGLQKAIRSKVLVLSRTYHESKWASRKKLFQRVTLQLPNFQDCLKALNKTWHPECFSCTRCHKQFGRGQGFHEKDSEPYCKFLIQSRKKIVSIAQFEWLLKWFARQIGGLLKTWTKVSLRTLWKVQVATCAGALSKPIQANCQAWIRPIPVKNAVVIMLNLQAVLAISRWLVPNVLDVTKP